MSKKAFKSQASSSRAVSGAFGAPLDGATFGTGFSSFSGVQSSPLSYVYEPPVLSEFSDPNIVVSFKNLQKKDGTTKSKALEDLLAFVSAPKNARDGIEEAILEAWIKVYPRTSIDSSRRVRQLAHTLQGQIAISCGKRMAKHMPKVVASWLAGLYDNDKSVSRAAHESFKQAFNSEEKIKNIWRVYQVSIQEYTRNVIVKETVNTLSDERTTSPDDADSKYVRVVGTAMMIVTHSIESTPEAEFEKSRTAFEELLKEENLWKFASHPDSFVRRAIYRLLAVALVKQKSALNPSNMSASILNLGLHSSQSGSALDYIKAVVLLSEQFPDIWTQHYRGTGKKSAVNQLCHFLKKGSQGGPPEYWTYITKLLAILPRDILLASTVEPSPKQSEDGDHFSAPILEALRDGVINRDEPRTNSGEAWIAYVKASELICSYLPDNNTRQNMLRSSLVPLVVQYIKPLSDQSSWTIGGPQQHNICTRVCDQLLRKAPDVLDNELLILSAKIIEDLKTSLPEQSKDYSKSQDTISAESKRWYSLQAAAMERDATTTMRLVISRTLPSEMEAAISTLKTRNGKPYSAAAALEIAISSLPKIFAEESVSKDILVKFVNKDIPHLLVSPSARHLIRILDLMKGTYDVHDAYSNCMKVLAEEPESRNKSYAMQAMLSSSGVASSDMLPSMAINCLRQAIAGNENSSWDVVMAAIDNPAAPKNLTDALLSTMTEGLILDAENEAPLHGLELTMSRNKTVLRDFAASSEGSNLLSNLIYKADGTKEILAQRARSLNVAIQASLKDVGDTGNATRPLIDMVKGGLDHVGTNSLSVDSLVGQAHKILAQAEQDDVASLITELLPSTAQWESALLPFMSMPPDPSISITNSFGGASALISKTSPIAPQLSTVQYRDRNSFQGVARDATGYSAIFRIALYVTKLATAMNVLSRATDDIQTISLENMALFLQLAGDNLSVLGSIPLWDSSVPDLESEITDFVAEAQGLLASWLQKTPLPEPIVRVSHSLLHKSSGLSPACYYNGRAYCAINAEAGEFHSYGPDDKKAKRLKEIRKSADTFADLALLTTSESKETLRFCNELVADLTGQGFNGVTDQESDGLRKLVILNYILQRPDDFVIEISQQRLVFLVKHLVDELPNADLTCRAEIFKCLTVVLVPIKDIYGSFWAETFRMIQQVWTHLPGDLSLPSLHASLRLLSLLRKPNMLEANDDLSDAWTEQKLEITKALVVLIGMMQDLPDESHQPRKIVNELLSRQLTGLGRLEEEEVDSLYPVLASESAALQQTAFKLLHENLPLKQEQISLDKALSKEYEAKLPEELLSLILATPTTDALVDSSFERTMPSFLQSYLFSWKLIFDHWSNASYSLQADYARSITDGTFVKDLLDLTFEILISARSKPVDASKFDIERYTPGLEPPEKDTHWLLIHLYYLCLRFLPAQSKSWWRDSTSRQTNIAVEAWTEKHISSLIIASELTTIREWAPSQASLDQPLTIKVSPSAREITASIPIDEQSMTIAIRLPPSYPLARAEVEGIHRVGVPENKWAAWIRNAQGQITTSSGGAGEGNALIDCMLAWRKNVTAAMKGQTECAICYSVVGADRTLPAKKCPTCKNNFHASCLFRWFRSSNSSSCPLCRNTFQYS